MIKLTYNQTKKINHRQGMAALFLVIVLSVSLLIMALGATWVGLTSLERGQLLEKNDAILALADGCLEQALLQLERDFNQTFTDPIILTSDTGECIIEVESTGFDQRQITIIGQLDIYSTKLSATISKINDGLVLIGWSDH